jgi:hypothetical protein
MNARHGIRANGEGGGTMLVTMMAATVLLGAAGAVCGLTAVTGLNAARSRNVMSALSVAEGGLEVMYAKWRSAARGNLGVPSNLAVAALNGPDNAPGGAGYPNVARYRYTAFSLTPVDAFHSAVANPPPVVLSPLSGRPGWVARTSNYLGRVAVEAPGRGNPSASVTRLFQKADAPIFQAAIFYEMNLEIHPGPDMYVNGLVHSNANLYASPGGSNNLTFERPVSYSGDYLAGFAPGDPGRPSQPVAPGYGANATLSKVSRMDPLGNEAANVFNTTDANPNNDGFRELIERPSAAAPDPAELSAIRFYNQAGLKILVDTALPANSPDRVKVFNREGARITQTSVVNAAKAALSAGETFQDNRETASMLVTTVDLSKLDAIVTAMGSASKPTDRTYNNVVYIADVSANPRGEVPAGGKKKAIRLRNGAVLSGDLSIASENPVYIQGDFNTGGPPSSVPSNATNGSSPLSAFATPQAPGYTRKSCAVFGDAVTVLSNNWSDSASTRTASNTTVNTAIFGGIIPTDYQVTPSVRSGYSGGAENFPRFLENWSGKNLCYYGSMVSMFVSQQANGIWGKSNVYSPPNRRWFFDSNFISRPPPGTLSSITYSRGRWVRQ